jgi:hypothetical protein
MDRTGRIKPYRHSRVADSSAHTRPSSSSAMHGDYVWLPEGELPERPAPTTVHGLTELARSTKREDTDDLIEIATTRGKRSTTC